MTVVFAPLPRRPPGSCQASKRRWPKPSVRGRGDEGCLGPLRFRQTTSGIALADRAVRRPSARRAIGGLFDILHTARRGGEGTERGPNPRQRQGGMTMAQHLQFNAFSRILHWTMAVLVLAMLFIGIGMVASLSDIIG